MCFNVMGFFKRRESLGFNPHLKGNVPKATSFLQKDPRLRESAARVSVVHGDGGTRGYLILMFQAYLPGDLLFLP